jgi:hypothetical protein
MDAVIVARGCLYLGTEIADSPCSWCAGNMSTPVDRRHLLPDGAPSFVRPSRGCPQNGTPRELVWTKKERYFPKSFVVLPAAPELERQ